MPQARIVLRDSVLETGERLLDVTGLGSMTELINVMFSRYGRHLEQTWEVVPAPGAQYTQVEPLPVETPPINEDFTFNEPLTGL